MAVNHCDGVRLGKPCRTLFAVGLLACPHCKSREFHEFGSRPEDEEHPMAKITRSTGASSGSAPAESGELVPRVDDGGQPAAPTEPVEVDATDEDADDVQPAETGAPDEDEDQDPDVTDPAERPNVRAPRDDWDRYAASRGLSQETIDGLSKTDLIATLNRVDTGELIVFEGQAIEAEQAAEPDTDA